MRLDEFDFFAFSSWASPHFFLLILNSIKIITNATPCSGSYLRNTNMSVKRALAYRFPNSKNRNMTLTFMIYGTDIGEIYATFGTYMAFI